jgi:hypothetical protein
MNGVFTKALGRMGFLSLIGALATIGFLIVSDAAHGFRITSLHSRLGACALVLIGAACESFQFTSPQARRERVKGMLLGAAFVLWGIEQLLPSSRWTTAMDTVVVAIFVVDLGMNIFCGLDGRRS